MIRYRAGGVAAAIIATVVVALLVPGAPATAAPHSSDSSHSPHSPRHRMGDYAPQRFAAEAGQLPAGMLTAVQRDLGLSAEEYLSRAAAAQDAGAVVGELSADGVDVVASRLDGTRLELTVASAADVAAAEATGATVVVGKAPRASAPLSVHAASALWGGTAWGYQIPNTNRGVRCSIGFTGYGPANHPEFVTAGHCLEDGTPASVNAIVQKVPNDNGSLGAAIGAPVADTFRYGNGYDSGRIGVDNAALTPAAVISTWGGGKGAPGASSLAIRGDASPVVGAPMCKSGSSSGWTCGHVLAVDPTNTVVSGQQVDAVITDACVLAGDSGGAAVVGAYALGITSGSTQTDTCAPRTQLGVFFPMHSTSGASVASQQTGWRLAVSLADPATTRPAGSAYFSSATLTGTVAGANSQTTVSVYYDGRTDAAGPNATVACDSSGRWSFALPSGAGAHSYRLVSSWGVQKSSGTTGTLTVVAKPAFSRISGADRYATAVQISQAAYPSPSTAKIAFLASGLSFPDALSAAPAAVKLGGPLLLTAPGSLSSTVAAELRRLAPKRIVVVGGPSAVSDIVKKAAAAIAPVTRVAGADRYATSRAVIGYAFSSAPSVYAATGAGFPDALSAGAAAAAGSSPVLLVRGTGTVDSATASLLRSLAPARIEVVGSVAVVSAGYATSLAAIAPVDRLGGPDRYATSDAVNTAAFTSAADIYLASGTTFPDALAGAALAGLRGEPLAIAPATCLPPAVVAQVGRLGARTLIALGGPSALNDSIGALAVCPG